MTLHRTALASLLADTAVAPDATIITAPRLLKTRYRAAEAATSALAAGGLVAARIHEARTGKRPHVSVASRHAEASLVSFALQKFHDPARAPTARVAPEERTAVAGFYPASDGGIVYLHPGFPHNTRQLLELLGVPDDRAAVARAVASRTAQTWEDDIAAHGLCGARLRSADEWDGCLAGRLLGARPVVEIIQIGDSSPRPWPKGGTRPLAGINVLDLTRVLAGPTCARTLALYGASALRVGAERLPSIPLFVADTGLGKRSAFVDLTTATGRADLDRLIDEADVFSQGYRSGALERLGYGVADVVKRRPGIVYVSINCYGHEGAFRARPGWEQLAQVVTGMAHQHGLDLHGEPGRPELQPAAVTDYTTGYLGALGALLALDRRARVGGSYWVRVSLARIGMWVRSLGRETSLPEPVPVSETESAGWRATVDTAWGPLEHLKSAVAFDGELLNWATPPVPLGTHPPRFG
jgi:crotonobetainyl-CoA:carnitine CoA-transferase CaiB-like acyl-CoA transferase